MILKSYKGRQKSARHQQFDADMLIGFAGKLDEFAVLRESFREIIEDRFEVENIKEVLRGLASGEIEVVVKAASAPSPMAFGLATLGASAGERQELDEGDAVDGVRKDWERGQRRKVRTNSQMRKRRKQ